MDGSGKVKPRLRGPAHLVRYADDFVMVFSLEEDARRVFDVLPKRFGKYGLRLHPEKTRLVRFDRPSIRSGSGKGHGSFDLLGFRHFWARSRQGSWVVMRKTASSRLARAVSRIDEWCRVHRHDPVREQHRALVSKLRGHYNYYGIRGNLRSLKAFLFLTTRTWFKWLRRRSRERPRWDWMNALLRIFPLPRPSIRPIA